jgi:L-galactose dehydrogenase
MEYRELGGTGLRVSALSFGASSLGGVFRNIDEGEAIRTVHVSLDHGINFIDVSPYYGATRAETVLGKALRQVKRDRYYLATKVGQYGEGQFDFSAARITRSVDESMARLGVDYFDLIQCHDIEFASPSQIVHETLPALVKLKQGGKVGHIGITGLPLKVFHNVLDQTPPGLVETILSFCRYALNDTMLEAELPYFRKKGIGIINASPTGMGLLTDRGCPSWHPASDEIKAGTRKAAEYCRSKGANIVELAIQFAVANRAIATTLVGSANPKNMLDNIAYATKPMNQQLLADVLEVLRPIHNFNYTRGLPENQDALIAQAVAAGAR